ncbi:MAG TPA: bifunctional serine/threonine-protein kinase/formylglycine-generating enzyme family protein [Pirellulaceae bacterium]
MNAEAPTEPGAGTDATLPLSASMVAACPTPAAGASANRLGPYELIEMLGQGGMGTVWKARHPRLDKLVALKLLPVHLMNDADAVGRFEREMKAVGKLEHAHIVRAMDAGLQGNIHYLVMEYIEGIDLARLIKNRGPRKLLEACQMIRHAALGLSHAHEHGLVHRDIKPSNLLLSKKGIIKILDLGLARLQNDKAAGEKSLTVNGEIMGTPDYMAPEQWQCAHTVGPAVDLYALGCTLYFLVTGKPPFAGESQTSFTQKMTAHLLQLPPALLTAPPELAALYQKLMAKDPDARPSSAKAVADELQIMIRNWAQSPAAPESIPWRPATEFTSAAKTPRFAVKNFKAWQLVVCLISFVAFGGIAAWFAIAPKPRSRETPDLQAEAKVGKDVPTASIESIRQSPPFALAPFDTAEAVEHQTKWAAYLGVPATYENSLGMKFKLIPPGEYNRGTPVDRVPALQETFKKGAEGKIPAEKMVGGLVVIAGESPEHHVRISRPFYFAECEVTQRDFEQVMKQNQSHFGPGGEGFQGDADQAQLLPVENVSYDEADDFCRRLGKRERLSYRLPTEAEWEYACRAGTSTPFWFGDSSQGAAPFARFRETSPEVVGRRQANPFGLQDMHGNVCEICEDFYVDRPYAEYGSEPVESPTGPSTGDSHVARGGGYGDVGIMSRSPSRRHFGSPTNNVGFRPVLSVEAVQAEVQRRK